MNVSARLLLLSILALGAATAVFALLSLSDVEAPDRHSTRDGDGAPLGLQPLARAEGQSEGSDHKDTSGRPSALAPEAWVPEFDAILEDVPRGDPRDQPISREVLNVGLNDEIGEIVEQLTDGGIMSAPPFRIRLVFGESDLPWLRRMQAQLVAYSKARAGSMSLEESQRVSAAIRGHLRKQLTAIAQVRLRDNEGARRRWEGRRVLNELDPDDPDARWLRSALDVALTRTLFQVAPDLLSTDDLNYVAPCEIQEIRRVERLHRAAYEANRVRTKVPISEWKQIEREYVEMVVRIVEGRRAR